MKLMRNGSLMEMATGEDTHAIARTMHDAGLAAWFGGSLMGAVGLNAAAEPIQDTRTKIEVVDKGWRRWQPANTMSIAAHLLGGAIILQDNWRRTKAQKGVMSATIAKSTLTLMALGATAYSRALGKKLAQQQFQAQGVLEPSEQTPPEMAKVQQQLKMMQWVIPALTGGMLAINSKMGEQQKPNQQHVGMLKRFMPERLLSR